MEKVTSKNTTEIAVHRFCTEASTLGIKPGECPQVLETDLGNGQPLVLEAIGTGGEITYLQAFGCVKLVVLND